MTIDEAIERLEESAFSYEYASKKFECVDNIKEFETSANEHRQVAEWLRELKELRAKCEPKPRSCKPTANYAKCKDCKWLTGRRSKVGVECMQPDNQKKWAQQAELNKKSGAFYTDVVAKYKAPTAKACTKYEPKEEAQITCYGTCTEKCGGWQDGACILGAERSD